MWDIKSGKTLLTYNEHTDEINCVALSGNTVITGSDDETARYPNSNF